MSVSADVERHRRRYLECGIPATKSGVARWVSCTQEVLDAYLLVGHAVEECALVFDSKQMVIGGAGARVEGWMRRGLFSRASCGPLMKKPIDLARESGGCR